MTEEKALKKKIKSIQKKEKKLQQGRDYIVKNRSVTLVHLIVSIVLGIWGIVNCVKNIPESVGWSALFCFNCVLCIASIAMLNGHPLLLFWKCGKKLNDVLDNIEFLTGFALLAIKIPAIAVLLIGYAIYGVGMVVPGVYAVISHKSSINYAKKLDELEKKIQSLKEEVNQESSKMVNSNS